VLKKPDIFKMLDDGSGRWKWEDGRGEMEVGRWE
jgi:hypothetical protein